MRAENGTNSTLNMEKKMARIIKKYPNRWEFSRILIVHYSQNGQYEQAIKMIENWIALNESLSESVNYNEAEEWLQILKEKENE